jgi:hypothetical protein
MDPDDKSRVASDTLVDPATVTLSPGTEFFMLWGGDNLPSLPDDGARPMAFPHTSRLPAASGSASPRSRPTLAQNGTRHAWRNKGTEPCSFVICFIGTPHGA